VPLNAVSPIAFREHKTGIEENTNNVRRDKRDLRGRGDFVLTAKVGVCDGVVGHWQVTRADLFYIRKLDHGRALLPRPSPPNDDHFSPGFKAILNVLQKYVRWSCEDWASYL
jgi:hypothetical protein